jgi:hydroxyacylglutathione hydrolase
MNSVQIRSLNLGELQTNCYIVWSEQSSTALVIDPADSADTISQFLLEQNVQLTAILLTHGHFDHCLGLLELSLNFEVPSYLHEQDIFLIKNAQTSAQHWLKHSVDPVPLPSHHLQDNSVLQCGDFSLTVLHTPGHTPGSVCLRLTSEATLFVDGNQIISNSGVVFTGDTLFKESYPETNHKYSNILDLRDSWEKLKKLDPTTTILPGHGEPATLEQALLFATT